MGSVRWRDEAERDLAQIIDFVAREYRIAGIREIVVRPNYVLIYRIALDTVWISNVFHSSRQYPPE